jgi:hypothetical protein
MSRRGGAAVARVGVMRHALARLPLALVVWTLRPRNAREMRYRP